MSPAEARAIQGFAYFDGCSVTELARRFCRHRRTIRKVLADAAYQALVATDE